MYDILSEFTQGKCVYHLERLHYLVESWNSGLMNDIWHGGGQPSNAIEPTTLYARMYLFSTTRVKRGKVCSEKGIRLPQNLTSKFVHFGMLKLYLSPVVSPCAQCTDSNMDESPPSSLRPIIIDRYSQWRRRDLFEEGQSWKLGHMALTANFRAGCSSCSITNSFVTNAVLIERAVTC